MVVVCNRKFDQLRLDTFILATTPDEDLVGDRQKTRICTSAGSYHRT